MLPRSSMVQNQQLPGRNGEFGVASAVPPPLPSTSPARQTPHKPAEALPPRPARLPFQSPPSNKLRAPVLATLPISQGTRVHSTRTSPVCRETPPLPCPFAFCALLRLQNS